VAQEATLPETARVHWRPRACEGTLRRTDRLWTLVTAAHTLPFLGACALLALRPVTVPFALLALLHAWAIPELYAARGARVLRQSLPTTAEPDRVALGLLGDLLDHKARELHARARVVVEGGRLGAWIVGEGGAVLVRPGGRRVHCYCVKVPDPQLPPCDRTAHLLLALRADEQGFVTIANVAFAGARWRLGRRLAAPLREALAVAAARARTM